MKKDDTKDEKYDRHLKMKKIQNMKKMKKR